MEKQRQALQDLVHPEGVCFGCGPAHEHGLHIKSYWDNDGEHVVADFLPDEKFRGWPGLAYGGFLAMLADCHCNWTAIASYYKAEGREPGSLPRIACATGTLSLRYRKPTPLGVPLRLKAKADGPVGRRTRIVCGIRAGDELTVSVEAVFFRVDPETFPPLASLPRPGVY